MMSKIHFQIEGKLAQLLGRQSMLNEAMPVFELAKNGYDADASKADIHFENLLSGSQRIRIIDNGHGMTKEDIENKFMMVATSSRNRKTTSPKGRVVAGEKGIGRFAMDRLSHKTTILSFPENENHGYKIIIDWDRYDEPGISFTEIGNEYEVIENQDLKRQGVEIIAERLRDEWDRNKIKKLERQLNKIVTPEGFKGKNSFSIKLHASELGIEGQNIESGYLKKAPYRLIGTLHQDGRTSLVIYFKGKKMVGFGIPNKFCKDGIVGDSEARCGPLQYKMWGYPFDTPGEELWRKYYGNRFEPNIKEWIEEAQGVKIYRDGFRVMPYGEPDNDWTDRASKQRSLSGALPKKHMIGHISISQKKNRRLIPSSTRFHMLEDEAFDDLKKFVAECDRILDKIMHDERVKVREKAKRDIPKLLEKKAKEIRKIKELPTHIKTALARDLNDYATHLIEEEETSRKEEERLLTKLEAYRDLASLGITTGMVSHEINRDIGNLVSLSESLRQIIKSEKIDRKELVGLQINLSSSTRFIRDYISLVRNFTVALKGDQKEFRKKIKFNIKSEIEFYKTQMDTLFQRNNIELLNLVPDDLEVFMYKADFQSIIFNLISNSFKSIIRHRTGMNQLEREIVKKKIKITIDPTVTANYLGINFSDDGTGIRESIRDRVFDLFFSDYQKEDEEMKGSGLGLTLVKEITEGYGGNVELLPESEFSSGASFLVTLKKEEISLKHEEPV